MEDNLLYDDEWGTNEINQLALHCWDAEFKK